MIHLNLLDLFFVLLYHNKNYFKTYKYNNDSMFALIRKLYDWTLEFADSPYSSLALFILSFSALELLELSN